MTRSTALLAAVLCLLLACSTSCILRRAPQTGVEELPPPPPAEPAPPPAPELRVLKVSGAGADETNFFTVRVEWTGTKPTEYTVDRWTMMVDRTGQTQSMLTVAKQTFEVKPGEPQLLKVQAIPIDPEKPPARNLIVEYDGMPVYELTRDIPNPAAQALIKTIERVDEALVEMLDLVSFVGDSIEYSPKNRDKVDPYLAIVVWDLSGDQPTPYIEPAVIEAAFITAFAGGIDAATFATHLQKKVPGITQKQALARALEIQTKVNALLAMAGLDVRMN